MSRIDALIKALLRIYPAGWRREYGAELQDVLSRRPLSARVAGNVVWNGLRQRARVSDPATRIGLVAMLIVLSSMVWNLAHPPAGAGFGVAIQDSSITWPRIDVAFLESELFVLALIAGGCWTRLRTGASPSRCGVAAMRLCAIAGAPIVVLGVLIGLGWIGLRAVGPGELLQDAMPPTWNYTYFTQDGYTPSAFAIVAGPVFQLPVAWIWGAVGGRLGRFIGCRMRRTPAVAK